MAAQVLLLKDADLNVRLAAISTLGSFGISAKESIPPLCERLFHEEDRRILEAVCRALIQIGADPDPILARMLDGLRSLDRRARVKFAELLARFGEHVSGSMDRVSREHLLPDLLGFVRDNTQDARARCAVIQLLGEWELQPERLASELANLLDDDDEGIRKRAMQALEHYRPASVACAPKIIQCLRNRPGDVAWLYAERFLRFVAPVEEHADLVVSALMEGLRAKDDWMRAMSASILGDLRVHAITAIPALCDAIRDDALPVRLMAVKSLVKLAEYARHAVPALIEARHDADATLRAMANAALEKIAPDKYGTLLIDESFANHAAPLPPIKVKARYLGNRRCQVGDEPPFTIGAKEARVLESLIELRTADKPTLIAKSGIEDAPRILGRICEKHPQLAAHIIRPGKRGQGGYSTTITQA